MGRLVPADGAHALGRAALVGGARVSVLDPGPVRQPIHLSRCRARVRGSGGADRPRTRPADECGMARLGAVHREHDRAHCDDRGRPGELARLPRHAQRRAAAHGPAVLPRRAWLRVVPGRSPGPGPRRPAARRWRSDVGRRAAGEGRQPLPRDGRQRLHVPQVVPAHNDIRWLDRARAFAMHGIEQCEHDAVRFGQMHHSLWTGDLGLAIYLWNCIHGTAEFPCLDVFLCSAPRPRSGG